MKNFFLDTSVMINYFREKAGFEELIDSLDGNLTSGYFCFAELFEGVYRSPNREKHKKIILHFMKGLNHVFGLDSQIAEKFGELRANLKRRGEVIEDIDIFIAATCIVDNLILVTENKKHFSRIKDLEIFEK